MFGFLKGPRGNRLYRQVYSGCCAVQHQEYGTSSLIFLSYEAIFVYFFALDSNQVSPPEKDSVTCCRLRRSQKIRSAVDPELAKFSAAFGMLLTSIKLDDDVQDDRSWLASFARWRLKKRIAKAHAYFQALDTDFENKVIGFLKAHAALEKSNTQTIEINDYVTPTANAFGYVFGLASQLFEDSPEFFDKETPKSTLQQLGQHVGAAIIAFDCAVDWNRDRRRGSFNPLANAEEVQLSLQLCRRSLAQAIWICADLFGKRSQTAAVLKAAFDRTGVVSLERSRKKPTWGTVRRTGWAILRRGDCDCPVDICCEGGSSSGSCCDCLQCLECCNGDCGACDCENNRKEPEKKVEASNHVVTPVTIGSRGVAIGPLNPSGMVRINNSDYPAKTSGTWVGDGEFVEVIAFESFGLLVAPINDIVQVQ
jgi:hypothetical protein